MEHPSRASLWQGHVFPGVVLRSVEGIRRAARPAVAILLVTLASVVIGLATGLIALPLSASPRPDASSPVARVLDDATTWRGQQEDPAVTLPSGVQVKSSNYFGVRLGDTTYFYNLAPRVSYDPLARGDVTAKQIRVVAVVGDAPDRVLIYTVVGGQQIAGSSQPSAVSR